MIEEDIGSYTCKTISDTSALFVLVSIFFSESVQACTDRRGKYEIYKKN